MTFIIFLVFFSLVAVLVTAGTIYGHKYNKEHCMGCQGYPVIVASPYDWLCEKHRTLKDRLDWIEWNVLGRD